MQAGQRNQVNNVNMSVKAACYSITVRTQLFLNKWHNPYTKQMRINYRHKKFAVQVAATSDMPCIRHIITLSKHIMKVLL